MELLLPFARDFGFPALLVILLLWHLRREYARVTERLSASEDWIKTTLAQLTSETAAALRENTRANRDLFRLLESRPCLYDDRRGDYKPHPSSVRDVCPDAFAKTTQKLKRNVS